MANLSKIFQLYKSCIVRITVELPNGDESNGTGFHIGNGYIVTARHVIDGRKKIKIVGEHNSSKEIDISRTLLLKDDTIDLALLETDFSLDYYMERVVIMEGKEEREKTDYIPIGDHLDDWLGDEFSLTKVLIMGYPTIPFSDKSVLFATEAEVNAVIDKYIGGHPHFIVSSIPRGGLSGAPVISEYGFLLGIVTEALHHNSFDNDSGYSAAISVQPLWDLIDESGVNVGENMEFLKMLENPDYIGEKVKTSKKSLINILTKALPWRKGKA